MNAQFREKVSVSEELAAVILSSWVKDHPDEDKPVQMTQLPWGAEVIADEEFALVDVNLEPPVQILVEGVKLEYCAGHVDTGDGPTLFYSVRMVP